MTELLFYKDPYLRETACKIVQVVDRGVILDQTIIFGRSCGVKPDTGILQLPSGRYIVTGRKEDNGKIIHLIEGEKLPLKGEEGTLAVNWERRIAMMKLHTTLHILSTVVWKEFDALVTGSDITPDKAKIDFDMDRNFTKEELQLIENKINKIIQDDHPTTSGVISPEEAQKIHGFIRTKTNNIPAGIKELRYTKIEGIDMQADGGIHVRSTSEIGKVRIVKQKNKGKGRRRLEIIIE